MCPAERQFLAASRRHSTLARAVITVSAQMLSLPAVPAAHLGWALAALVVSGAWNGYLFVRLAQPGRARPGSTRPGGARLFLVDIAFLGLLLAAQPRIEVPGMVGLGVGWTQMLAITALIAHPWQFPEIGTPLRTAAAAVVAGVFGVGAAAVVGWRPGVVLEPAVWLFVTAVLSRVLFRLLRSAAEAVDDAGQAHERLRAATELARARRAAEQEHLASIHDTAAATLMMVGLGAVSASDAGLRAQAARDLHVLQPGNRPGQPQSHPDEPADDWQVRLDEVVAQSGLEVELQLGGTGPTPPPEVAAALVGAVREALQNIARHTPGRRAHIAVRRPSAGLEIEIWDDESGLPPGTPLPGVPEEPFVTGAPIGLKGGRGIRHSIIERMERVGGRATVTGATGGSAEGSAGGSAGVRVRLQWSPPEPGPSRRSAVSASTLLRRLRFCLIITLVVVTARSIATDVRGEWVLQLPAFAVIAGCVLVAVREPAGRRRYAVYAVAVVAGAVITATVPAADLLGSADTSWRIVGWLAVLLLLEESIWLVVALIAADFAVLLVQFGLAGRLDRGGVVLFAMAVMVDAGAGVTFAVAGSVLRRTADIADRLAVRDARLRTTTLIAQGVRADQAARYHDVADTVIPLLEGLRTGSLSPADPEVRRRSAIEAARLRRLMAEGDNVRDQLVHELRACVDAAERAGVTVDVALRGTGPHLPLQERRRLTEPVIEVLFLARTKARVTLVAEPRDVTVSVVADIPDGADIPEGAGADYRPPAGVEVLRSADRLWVTSRWHQPELSELEPELSEPEPERDVS